MKPEQVILNEQDKLEVVQQIPDATEKLIDRIVPHKGHTLFEINCITGDIVVAEFDSVSATFKGGVKKKLIVKPNCLYISCLNKKNAKKKFADWLMSRTIQQHK